MFEVGEILRRTGKVVLRELESDRYARTELAPAIEEEEEGR